MADLRSIFLPQEKRIRDFIFIPLAIALALAFVFAKGFNFDLTNIKELINSLATSEGIDVSKRVAAFYKTFAVLAVAFGGSLIVVNRIINRINHDGLKTVNALAFAISSLFIWKLMQVDVSAEMQLLTALVISAVPFIWKEKFSTLHYAFANMAAIAIFLLLREISSVINISFIISLPVSIVVFGIIFHFLVNKNSALILLLSRMSFVPLIVYCLEELPYIFASHDIKVSPVLILILGLTIILFILIRKNRKEKEFNLSSFYAIYFPWFLAGFLAVCLFTPTVTPKIDWFEDGNRLLPLQQWFQFNRWPLIHTFNSHALSDFFPGLIYSIFNHHDPAGFYLYSYLVTVVVMVLMYLMVFKLTESGPFAIFFTLIYPYSDLIFPSYYSLFPLLVLSFIYLVEKRNVQSYILFALTVIFMCLWRVDIGSASLFTAIVCVLLYFLIPGNWPRRSDIVKVGIVKIGFFSLLFVLLYLKFGKTLFVSAKDALSYLSSFQSYGLLALSPNADMRYFFLYFIMPVLVFLSGCYHYYLLFTGRAKSVAVASGIFFLSVFYIFNFQRGLVRHSLTEGWDTAFTSFGYFILAFSFVSNKKMDVKTATVFILAATFLVNTYVPGEVNANNGKSFTMITQSLRVKNEKNVVSSERIKFRQEDAERYVEFKNWFDQNFSDKATFLDFSNSPMMYYFTGRQLPNYFCQIPHTAHNEFLQKRFIEDLSQYEIPIVVFASTPNGYWDALDGIPNTVRHTLIAEYIYKNYHPFTILSGHSVWLKNDVAFSRNEGINLSKMTTENITDDSGNISSDKNNLPIMLSTDSVKTPAVLHLIIRSENNGKLVFMNNGKESVANVYGGLNHLKFPVYEKGNVGFILREGIVVHLDSAYYVSSEFTEDYQSDVIVNYSLKQLPYYAGMINKSEGTVVKLGTKTFTADKEVRLSFKQNSGSCYFNFSAANNISSTDIPVIIGYGKDNEKRGSFDFIIKKNTPLSSYIVPFLSQYNWWKGDNNWISIYPVEQNVMLENLQIISK